MSTDISYLYRNNKYAKDGRQVTPWVKYPENSTRGDRRRIEREEAKLLKKMRGW